MNPQSKNPTFLAGDFISEGAVRGALGRRRRRVRPAAPGDTSRHAPAAAMTAADRAATGPAPRRGAPLRRWSVAELIARGVPRPVDGLRG